VGNEILLFKYTVFTTGPRRREYFRCSAKHTGLPENKLACITTDNGSNATVAVEILGWNGLSYFGHNLHLLIANAIKDDDRISCAIGIAHEIVGAFAHSWKKKRDLKKVQTEINLPQHSLVRVLYSFGNLL